MAYEFAGGRVDRTVAADDDYEDFAGGAGFAISPDDGNGTFDDGNAVNDGETNLRDFTGDLSGMEAGAHA